MSVDIIKTRSKRLVVGLYVVPTLSYRGWAALWACKRADAVWGFVGRLMWFGLTFYIREKPSFPVPYCHWIRGWYLWLFGKRITLRPWKAKQQ
jgi:hypothetical protein